MLEVTSSGFLNNTIMPVEYTGYGEDYSPPFMLSGIVPQAKTLAIVMVDLDVPLVRDYPHWLIWNLPIQAEIPENIPYGEKLTQLENAQQGIAYGQHQYKGPKPPKFMRKPHRYVFTVYVLDKELTLPSTSKYQELLKAMQGHILQQSSITGLYKN